MFIARLKNFQTTPRLFDLSRSLPLSCRDFGCGRAISFGNVLIQNFSLTGSESFRSPPLPSPLLCSSLALRVRLSHWERVGEGGVRASLTSARGIKLDTHPICLFLRLEVRQLHHR